MMSSIGTFFFNDTATTEIYTLSLHDALPIWGARDGSGGRRRRPPGLLQELGAGGGRAPRALRPVHQRQIGRANHRTPATPISRVSCSAWKTYKASLK